MTRFTSECDLCAELLTEYIAAANETVDARESLRHRPDPSSRQLASALIENALKRRQRARQRLSQHKEQRH